MRQKGAPKYAAVLFGLKFGKCIKEGVQTLSSRVYENKASETQNIQAKIDTLRRSSSDKGLFPFCVHDNKTKAKKTWDFVFQFFKSTKKRIIL